jgi:phage tail sheath protein FI
MAEFFHGIKYTELKSRIRTISVIRTGIVGLIVTAPIHLLPVKQRTLNRNIVIASDADTAYYCGAELDSAGYSAHTSINAVFSQGGGTIIAINVFDPTRHRTLGADKTTSGSHSLTANIATITTENPHGLAVGEFVNVAGFTGGLAPLNQSYVRVKAVPSTSTFTYDLENADIVSTASTSGIVKKITFDPTLVSLADVIGTVDAQGNRSGMKVWQDARTTIGDTPRLLAVPGYSTQESVAVALEVIAERIGATYFLDAPAGLSTQDVVEARGVTGTLNLNTSSTRGYICDMHVWAFNPITEKDELRPASPYFCGIQARVDREKGFWYSISNNPIRNITGVERSIDFDVMNPDSEANFINSKGVGTIVREYGTGFITWGNRSAAFPSNADPDSFLCIRRVMDVLKYSLGYNMRPFLDAPMNRANITSVLASMNAFVRNLIGLGALVGGEVTFEESLNDPSNLAQGKIKFSLEHMAPPPMENIEIEAEMKTEFLLSLFEN